MTINSIQTAQIGVVHLVRACNGIAPFQRFLATYQTCHGGIAHDLLIVYKGFDSPETLQSYNALLAEYKFPATYQPLQISDAGFDISAYSVAARHFPHAFLCFVNSYTQLRDTLWLSKLYTHLTQDGVGVVGASGSWETFVPSLLHERARLNKRGLAGRIRGYLRLGYQQMRYPAFPNPHIRTNGFMLSRTLLLELRGSNPRNKEGAWEFENSRRSMTCQIRARGLRPLIVGKDGIGYEIEQWPRSNTFRLGNQANLLMTDNRTEEYANATPDAKRALSEAAWQK